MIVSTNRLMILAMMMVITISANAARPLVACYQRDARMQVTLDADRLFHLLSICLSKGHGEFSEMGVPFLHVKHELCSFRTYAIIVSRN